MAPMLALLAAALTTAAPLPALARSAAPAPDDTGGRLAVAAAVGATASPTGSDADVTAAATDPVESTVAPASPKSGEQVPNDVGIPVAGMPDEAMGTGWLATGAALVPGVLLHGAGHYARGDRSTAYRLLAMEGIGLGGLVGGIALLGSVGGSEKLAPVYVPLAVSGAGLFAVSFLADVAGTARGGRPWALPARPEGSLALGAGYAGLFASPHGLGHLGRLSLDYRTGRLELGAGTLLAPSGEFAEYTGRLGYRLWGRDGDPVTRLFLRADLDRQDFSVEGFDISTGRLFGELRWNLGDLVSSLRNAWLLGRLGIGADVFSYREVAADDTLAFLVVDVGMGLAAADGVEFQLLYRHRKGELPGGLLTTDGLTGFVGFVELQGRVAVAPRWALLPGIKVGNGVLPWLAIESQLF